MEKLPEKKIERCNPYFIYEKSMFILDRTLKRLWITIIVLISLLFFTNAAWIYYESKWDTVQESTVIKANQSGSDVNIVGAGDVAYGSECDDN